MAWNPFKRLIANTWGQSGAVGYPISASLMIGNNPPALVRPRHVTDEERRALAEHFAFLDRVLIHPNATLLDAWSGGRIGGFEGPQISQSDTDGQTFGFNVYLRPGAGGIVLLAHELVHVRQFVARSESLQKFGYDYFRGYYEAGRCYRNNPMEAEAYDFTRRHFS